MATTITVVNDKNITVLVTRGLTGPNVTGLDLVDTTSIEVTNIKAKDGTASATIANTTGVMTLTSPVLTTPTLGTPSSGTVTNLTGTASININGTVGATTPSTGSFTTLTTSSTVTHNGGTANGVTYLDATKTLTSGTALTFSGSVLTITDGSQSGIQPPVGNEMLHLAGQTGGRRLLMDAYSASGPVIMGRQSNGTSDSRSPTIAGNTLLFIDAKGSAAYSGSVGFSPQFTGYLRIVASEDFLPSAQGTHIELGVTPIGTTQYIGVLTVTSTATTIATPCKAQSFTNLAANKYARLIPSTAYSRKLVVAGSSVAYGTGATSDQGWAYMLGQTLMSNGWSYANASIGGNTTSDLISRFYTDVVPLQPDVVLISLSLANEGILNAGTKEIVFNQFVNNICTLVSMCRQQGFTAIVTGCYPNNAYTPVEYAYTKQADKAFQTLQIPFISFLGSVDNGLGKWRDSMYADAGHPNDNGHTSVYRSIVHSLFTQLPYAEQSVRLDYHPVTEVVMTGDVSTASPIVCDFANEPVGSWTVMLNARAVNTSVPTGIALVSVENGLGSPLRIRAPAGFWEVATTSTLVSSSVAPLDLFAHQLAITYDYITDAIKFYIDGILHGTSSTAGYGANITKVSFLGRSDLPSVNANGFAVSNLAVYKTALNADQILESARAFYPTANLLAFAPCFDSALAAQNRLSNLARVKQALYISTPNLTRA